MSEQLPIRSDSPSGGTAPKVAEVMIIPCLSSAPNHSRNSLMDLKLISTVLAPFYRWESTVSGNLNGLPKQNWAFRAGQIVYP